MLHGPRAVRASRAVPAARGPSEEPVPDATPPDPTAEPSAQGPAGPLDGVRVLDVTHVMAGSYCGLLLAEMGADVVKVERAGGGDDLRRNQTRAGGAFRPFDAVNHGKRSLALDLRDPRGADALRRLADGADVFVENYRPGKLDALGVGPVALRARNPRLVTCSISGFGASGPEARVPGFDLVAQGAAGIMSLTGEPGRPPVVAGVPLSDLNAGAFAALGICSALLERERSGQGQHVDTSLFEAALAYTIWESATWFDTGSVPGPAGSSHRLGSPYAAFATADGHLTLGAATQANWERLCAALGRDDLAADPRYADGLGRLRNKPALFAELEAAFAGDTTERWIERLRAAGVPCGPVRTIDAAHASEQARARGMSVSLGEHDGRERFVVGVPAKLSRTPWRVRGWAAGYGDHGADVLREAGFDEGEIARLARDGVLQGGEG
jgi:formyl-CoA transferase